MTLGPWGLDAGSGGGTPAGGPAPLDGGIEDVRPPPRRGWIWLLLIVLLLGGGGAAGYYLHLRNRELAEIEALMASAGDLPPEERAAAYRKVLSSKAHDSFRTDAALRLGALADPEAAPVLLAAVTDAGQVSQAAAEALGRMNRAGRLGQGEVTQARDRIFPQMQVAQGMAKTQFAFALALLQDQRCIEPLLQGYMESEQARAIAGLDAHLVAQFAGTDKLVELTRSEDPAVRMFAAQALGEKRAPAGADALVKLLADSNRSVVQSAAESLAKVDSTRAGPELIRLMQKQPDLQGSLVVALRDAVGAPGLQPIYENAQDWQLKLRLIQHVRAPPPPGRSVPPDVPRGIGDPRGGEMCHHFYTTFEGPREQQEMGLWCLEELGDPRAADGLFKVANEPFDPERDSIIDDSIKSIGYLKLPGTKELLLDMLKQGKGRPATILNALGRVGRGDVALGTKIERFTHCPEADVLSGGACDRETALKVLGRIQWPGALKLMTETAARHPDDKVATRIESRDVWQEFRLRDRLAALEGLAHLGDPAAAELLMTTLEDTEDDPEVRRDAGRALAYSMSDEVIPLVLAKIRDDSLDPETRKFYVHALWHRPNQEAVDALFRMLESTLDHPGLLMSAGFALGEAGESLIDQQRLRALLERTDADHLVPACLAALMAGDEDTVAALLRVFENQQGVEAQVRDRFAGDQGHPFYLTPALFESGRVYRRLFNAHFLREANEGAHGWAWQHLIGRMLVGTVASPNGMSAHEVVGRLAEDVRTSDNPQWQRMAAVALVRMGYRGQVLMLAAEDGPHAEVARRVLAGE